MIDQRNGVADYQFVRLLDDLGHCRYYVARRPARLPGDGDLVAVKVMAGMTTDEGFARAVGELTAFAAVQSPHLVTLLDAGQEGDTFFYAMEHHPLGSLATPTRPLGRDHVLRAVADAARAADALHEAGIAHCDIKPANILVTEDGGCLADLGVAQALTPGQTVSSMADLGSLEFVDPALLLGQTPGRASDIWSLGATLHRVLTGIGLHPELSDVDPLLALRTVLSRDPTMSAGLNPAETALVAACIDPDAARRPPTAADVARTIEGWAAP